MKREEFVCTRCIKCANGDCRLNPEPFALLDPDSHWCAQGQWHQWSERYQEMEPYYWGEWEDDGQAS
jgi:hypothetical protein